VLLVHRAWHGAWCWDPVVARLADRGVPVVALDLPGHGASGEPLGDLASDAAALRGVLDGLDDAVVCGHSYGGAVISDGGDHPAARHLVYLAAILLDEGESCTSATATMVDGEGASRLVGAMREGPDGSVLLDPEAAVDALYHDCTPDDAAWAVERLGGQRPASLAQPASHAAWRRVPSTYVVCTEDRVLPAPVQRQLAARAGTVVEWPTSHSPFLSQPDRVADLLAQLAS